MIVIAGNAFPDTHEEIARAIELGAEVIRYHDFIARFIEPYTSIAVTGSHGKTSTTGLLAHVLSGINPTSYLIGMALATANQMLISLHLKRVSIAVISGLFTRLCDYDEYRF